MSVLIMLWGSAVLSGCSSEEGQSPERVESVLDARVYRFCHIDGANADEAQIWCELLADLPPERCPGLRATCAGARTEDPRSVACDPSEGGKEDAIAGAPERPPEEEPPNCGEPPDAEAGQSLLRWVAALAVAALVLLLLRLLWVSFGRRKRQPAEVTPLPEPMLIEGDGDEGVPDAPSGDLLDAARRALAQGRASDAVMLARGAVLRRLGEIGRIWLHRSRTDREYVRSVRSDPAIYAELREICAAAEAVRWEGARLDPPRAVRALQAAERLFALLSAQRAGGSGAAGGAGLVLAFFLAWPGEAWAQGFDYDRYGPEGDAALLDVLLLYGYDAGFRLTSLGALDERSDALIIDLLQIEPTDEQWSHLRSWVEQGGVLLLAGEPEGLPELGQAKPAVGEIWLSEAFAATGLPVPRWPGGPAKAFHGGQGWPLVWDESGGAVIEVLDLGQGVVVAIADPILLWNGAFVHPDNERFVGELLYTGQSVMGWPMGHPARVQLATRAAVSTPSEGSDQQTNDLVGALATAGLLLFVLQLIASGALVALWKGWPFSPLRDPPDSGRHAFVEHVRALGTRYWRLQATAHAERQLASLWLLRLGVPGLELAAQRAGYSPERARAWAKEIEAVAVSESDPEGRGNPGRMEELWRITRTAK